MRYDTDPVRHKAHQIKAMAAEQAPQAQKVTTKKAKKEEAKEE